MKSYLGIFVCLSGLPLGHFIASEIAAQPFVADVKDRVYIALVSVFFGMAIGNAMILAGGTYSSKAEISIYSCILGLVSFFFADVSVIGTVLLATACAAVARVAARCGIPRIQRMKPFTREPSNH